MHLKHCMDLFLGYILHLTPTLNPPLTNRRGEFLQQDALDPILSVRQMERFETLLLLLIF